MTKLQKASPNAVGPVIDYGDHAGQGFENTTASDFAIPFLTVLQDNSPQAKKADPKYMKGAEGGMFLNSVTGELIPGTGFTFVPVLTEHVYIEYTPRDQGGGFMGRHELNSQIVVETLKSGSKNDKGRPITKAGTELVETFQMYGLVLDEPGAVDYRGIAVLGFTSTKIKPYRQYMSTVRQNKALARAPLFAHQCQVSTIGQVKNQDSFYNVRLVPAVDNDVEKSALPPGHQLLDIAQELKNQVQKGAARASYESVQGETSNNDEAAF